MNNNISIKYIVYYTTEHPFVESEILYNSSDCT